MAESKAWRSVSFSNVLSLTTTLAAGVLLAGCGDGDPEPVELDRSTVVAIFGKDGVAPPPEPDPDLVALGRQLYHDEDLSKNGNLSCASCHDLRQYGQDGKATSPGSTGELGERNSPTSINAYRQFVQFWDGRAADVENQAMGPMMNAIEHGFTDESELIEILEGKDEYVTAFGKHFEGEDPVTLQNFGKAVGAFERTLKTRSRFDDYLDGDEDALTAAEKRGLKTFMEVGCTTCHISRTVGGTMYHKLGLVVPYETEDKGRGAHTGNAAENYFFKVPMLLNVAETAPYFHDGSVETLEKAVRLMGKHQLGKDLTDDQVGSIVSFLESLTGELVE